jgi:hypothetical protein
LVPWPVGTTVLNKLPNSLQTKAKHALQEIWMAETRMDAEAAFDRFIEVCRLKYEKAVECLGEKIVRRCSPSTTSPLSTGRTCGPPIRSKARSRPSGIAPSDQRAASPTRPH